MRGCIFFYREALCISKSSTVAEAMPEIRGYEFIAIFDADFHPDSDFLLRTVPCAHFRAFLTLSASHSRFSDLVHNADVGFVQTRWVYANQFTSVLTVVQAISLNYHFACEQFARVATGSFLNFNGTAGVWRRSCIEQAGGWLARTTVEDSAYCSVSLPILTRRCSGPLAARILPGLALCVFA